MGRSLAKGVVNPTGGVGRDPKGSRRINPCNTSSGTNHDEIPISIGIPKRNTPTGRGVGGAFQTRTPF